MLNLVLKKNPYIYGKIIRKDVCNETNDVQNFKGSGVTTNLQDIKKQIIDKNNEMVKISQQNKLH